MRTTVLYEFAVITFFLLASKVTSQWFWQNPMPQGNNLDDIFFINSSTGWCCGQAGSILKTTNGGADWQYYPIKMPEAIQGIHFINENTGFAGSWDWGTTGKILKTTNGGVNFTIIKQISNNGCSDVYFSDNNNGWVAGTYGKIFFTSNGGNNWVEQATVSSSDITRLCFLNSNTGYASCWDGKILKTTDKGTNWTLLYSETGKIFYSVYFLDYSTGFITGYNGLLYRTSNGGINWQNLSSSSTYGNYVMDVKFIDLNTGWLATGNSGSSKDIFKTTNGGLNWIKQNVYLKNDETLTRLCVTDADNIYCIGDAGTILKTTNMGNNWYYQTKGFFNWLNNIYFINENTGWATGAILQTTVYKSTDGGTMWDSLSGFNSQPTKLLFFNSSTGICVCNGGQIWRSSDGGFKWSGMVNPANAGITDMSFINANTGWMCTGAGPLIKTTNNGFNWQIAGNNPGCYLTVIWFFDSNTGLAAGDNCNYLYMTTNGGQNWKQNSTQMITEYRDVYFQNNNIGWMCGYNGVIVKTTNQGSNWVQQSSGIQTNLHAIQFVNENTGFVCGDNSVIMKSTNGGESWTKFNIDVSWFYIFFSLKFINENTGWVAGVDGHILKTTNGGSTFILKNINEIPTSSNLYLNYPNPFNPSTKIRFDIPNSIPLQRGIVSLKVYDITGKEVTVLVNEVLQPGTYEVTFDGSGLTGGVYFYKLQAGEYSVTKRMVLIK